MGRTAGLWTRKCTVKPQQLEVMMGTPDRFEQTKDAIRNRLKRICGHMDDADFEQMVEKIAVNQLKPSGDTWRVLTRDSDGASPVT
jgi:hypothetical protein